MDFTFWCRPQWKGYYMLSKAPCAMFMTILQSACLLIVGTLPGWFHVSLLQKVLVEKLMSILSGGSDMGAEAAVICGWASSSWNCLSTHTCSTCLHHEPIGLCSYIQGVSNPLDSCLPAPGTVSLQRKHGFTAMLLQIPSRRTTTTVLCCFS